MEHAVTVWSDWHKAAISAIDWQFTTNARTKLHHLYPAVDASRTTRTARSGQATGLRLSLQCGPAGGRAQLSSPLGRSVPRILAHRLCEGCSFPSTRVVGDPSMPVGVAHPLGVPALANFEQRGCFRDLVCAVGDSG